MRKKSFFAPIICLPLFACGGDTGGHITVPDSHLGSGSGSGSGSGPAPCTATASYGAADFGSGSDQFAQTDGSGTTGSNAHTEVWGAFLNADAAPDAIQLELYAASGGFTGDIVAGTYPITGGDAQYKTCGICVRIFTDIDANNNSVDEYLASAGTVTLSSVSGANFAGTLSNITFDHVTIATDFTSTVVGDCTSTLTSGTMATALAVGSGSAQLTGPIHFGGSIHFTGHLANRHR
jgi:hypothetical protein